MTPMLPLTSNFNSSSTPPTPPQKSSPVNPGLITYTYDNISTDVFGFTNVGLGLFGMLQGRSSYIETAYFDGMLWIERGNDMSGEYFNVYVRV